VSENFKYVSLKPVEIPAKFFVPLLMLVSTSLLLCLPYPIMIDVEPEIVELFIGGNRKIKQVRAKLDVLASQ